MYVVQWNVRTPSRHLVLPLPPRAMMCRQEPQGSPNANGGRASCSRDRGCHVRAIQHYARVRACLPVPAASELEAVVSVRASEDQNKPARRARFIWDIVRERERRWRSVTASPRTVQYSFVRPSVRPASSSSSINRARKLDSALSSDSSLTE